ncbi:hypothetical protein BACIT_2553 [Bacillus amyloliquefaciens]|nr:hypothetical protein BACIT_2553 [Bacillus amyloliquefaciens]
MYGTSDIPSFMKISDKENHYQCDYITAFIEKHAHFLRKTFFFYMKLGLLKEKIKVLY